MAGRIAFIYNWVPNVERKGVYSECSTRRTVDSVEDALRQGGYRTISVNLQSRKQLEQRFRQAKPNFALVIAEGFLDSPATLYDGTGAALVRQSLAEMGIPSSHSPVRAMELCRHKDLTYRILAKAGVRIPWYRFLAAPAEARVFAQSNVKYPLFIKPAGGGNSVGIDETSLVRDFRELSLRIESVFDFLGPIGLVAEEYLPGSEYTVGVVGNNQPAVLPPVVFCHNLVRTTSVKKAESMDRVPIELVSPQDTIYPSFRELALRSYSALGCADIVRIDFKADGQGRLHVIDVNGTPSLGRASSLARMMAAVNVDYAGFINLVLYYGLLRNGLAAELTEPVAAAKEILVQLSNQGQVA